MQIVTSTKQYNDELHKKKTTTNIAFVFCRLLIYLVVPLNLVWMNLER